MTATRTAKTATGRWNGKCRKCGAKMSVFIEPGTDAAAQQYASPFVDCECGGWITLRPVMGRYRAGKRCDARCTGATGYDCECSCGGENHGADNVAANL